MPNVAAYMIAKTFLADWETRLGVSGFITMDRGRKFESDLLGKLLRLLSPLNIHTTSYYPRADGLREKLLHILKASS